MLTANEWGILIVAIVAISSVVTLIILGLRNEGGAIVPFGSVKPVFREPYRTNVVPPKPQKPPIVLVGEDSGKVKYRHSDGSITS